jgi:hypothetical protein
MKHNGKHNFSSTTPIEITEINDLIEVTRPIMKKIFILLLLIATHIQAQIIPIQPIEKCFLCNSSPSLTMYWQGKDSKALIIFIPGGEGRIGFKEDQIDHPYYFFQMLKRLTNPSLTSGKYDVVLLDSPTELSPNQYYPSARAASDHLIRIESTIRYYKEKTGLPIWLMGHSNGGISLTEFFKYSKKNNKTDLISGMIASGIRNESYFEAPINFPMLFIHHEKDGCSHTQSHASLANFQKVKLITQFPVEYIDVASGAPEKRDPCRSGHHMFFGANEEASKAIDGFLLKIYP